MNKDIEIRNRVKEHYKDALKKIPEEQIIGIFLEGSQNYGMDLPDSDIDTKLLVFPTIDDIIFNKTPLSTTWIRENNEHISVKDIRLAFNTFKKQNLNFLEILFTKYCYVNPTYLKAWRHLYIWAEDIARYDRYAAVMAMCGVAQNKFNMIFKKSECTEESINKYGYAPKQLHHLKRIECFLERYLNGNLYITCMQPPAYITQELVDIKKGKYNKFQAENMALEAIDHINQMREDVINNRNKFPVDTFIDKVLSDCQREFMLQYLHREV